MSTQSTNTQPPAAGQAAQTPFAVALRLADQISNLDMDSATKERVAMTNLICAAIDGRDRKHNAKIAALVESLESLLSADDAICENIGLKSDQAMMRIAALDQARAALALAKSTQP
jgi:hypothetical protein